MQETTEIFFISKFCLFFLQELKQYLFDKDYTPLFTEYDATHELQSKSVYLLCDGLKEFIFNKFKDSAKMEQISRVCQATVDIFPCLKVIPSVVGGIVSVKCLFLIARFG